jgi:hypothetical protein
MIALAIIISCGLVFVLVAYAKAFTSNGLDQDFIQYWAAGKLLASHSNPYDLQQLLSIEHHVGMQRIRPYVSLSPPVALEFALPLGFLTVKTGVMIWEIAQLVSTAISIWVLWSLFGIPDSCFHLLGSGFAPVIGCLWAGQLGTFFLLSLALFLRFHRRRPFVAGVALMPFALKPQLFLPLLVAIIVFCVVRKQFTILAGAASGLAVSCAVSLLIDPHAWTHYIAMTSSLPVMAVFAPTVGMALRFAISPSSTSTEFIPEMIGCAWAAWYVWTRNSRWDWLEDGSLVVMVSVICAPYAYFFDQTLLFPAILPAIYCSRKSILSFLILSLLQVGATTLLSVQSNAHSALYLWTAPGWFIWYLCAKYIWSASRLHLSIQQTA